MTKRYRALRTLSTIYNVLANLVALGSLLFIGSYFWRALTEEPARITFGGNTSSIYRYGFETAMRDAFFTALAGGLLALTLFAASQLLHVLMDIEENTHASRAALMQLLRTQTPGAWQAYPEPHDPSPQHGGFRLERVRQQYMGPPEG